MKITVIARTGKRKTSVEQLTPTAFCVSVTAPARDGRANQAIIEALSDYFHISPAKIILLSGSTSSTKIYSLLVDKL